MRYLLPFIATAALIGCSTYQNDSRSGVDSARLSQALSAQEEKAKERYNARNPQQTIEFFGIEPGMTVVEALPGGGWYSKILLPYLGNDGRLIGVDYAQEMWPLFGFFSTDQIEAKKTWTADWTKDANGWRNSGDDAYVAAFKFGDMPATLSETVDAVLFVRALHNLSRFNDQGQYLSSALNDTMRVLKPGGIVGIVQHRAPEDAPAASVKGGRGYLKQSDVIAFMKKAGFEFVGSSEVNANPNDQPAAEDIVWRLPPTLFTSREDEMLRAKMNAIGESDRMTLKFRKP
ncbi:MAG: methyltransferase [Pseudomonadota bacterium]